jgi:hypothetical protein
MGALYPLLRSLPAEVPPGYKNGPADCSAGPSTDVVVGALSVVSASGAPKEPAQKAVGLEPRAEARMAQEPRAEAR